MPKRFAKDYSLTLGKQGIVMKAITRKKFLVQMGMIGTAAALFDGCNVVMENGEKVKTVTIEDVKHEPVVLLF